MAVEKIDETDEGYYVQSGDVREWRWKKAKAPERLAVTTESAAAVVPPRKKATARKRTTARKKR
jgi:uncharacterized protein with NAD-binding domain and iron-sulfur cluster